MKKATRNFLDEIIACLISRRDEWTINGTIMQHTSGVQIHKNADGNLSFTPSLDLTAQEQQRLKEVVNDLRRQFITDELGTTGLTERVNTDHLRRKNKFFFSNVLHSIRTDPTSWEQDAHHLKHASGIKVWIANGVQHRRFEHPALDITDSEKALMQEAVEQHKRYLVLAQINSTLPQIDASAKTWGSRCPFCLEKPELKTFRCECDALLHYECAQECGKCPICNEELNLRKVIKKENDLIELVETENYWKLWLRASAKILGKHPLAAVGLAGGLATIALLVV
jgi:hypothetical protein